jgi:uncharacterized secreted protein with C-terminal beta-propeller domain
VYFWRVIIMKQNDFDYIKNKMDFENIVAPDSLSEGNIPALCDKADAANDVIKMKKSNKPLKRVVALVACLAIFVGVVAVAKTGRVPKLTDYRNDDYSNAQIQNIVTFKSYDEIDALLKENNKQSLRETVTGAIGGILRYNTDSTAATDSATDGYGVVEKSESAAAAPKSYSETYKQVDSVDEGDIIKTDGEYIYYIPDLDSDNIRIYKAENGKTEKVATIHTDNGTEHFNEMYIAGNKLIAVGDRMDYNKKSHRYGYTKTLTFVRTYDISDKSNPTQLYEFKQSGSYSNSRMVGDYLYLISNHMPFMFYRGMVDYYDDVVIAEGESESEVTAATEKEEDKEEEEKTYPQCGTDELKTIPVGDICGGKDATEERYCVISAINTKDGDANKIKTKAFLGITDNLYCNEKNMYLAATVWHYKEGYTYDANAETQLIRYSFDKDKITLSGSVMVDGTVNNQYSMDEHDGYFRIATTSTGTKDVDTNNLFVFDKNLNQKGRVTGFARDESIRAVRFMGNTAYVITFEQTDPLFVIDLTNPEKPEIKGEVKLDGFSTSLTPFGENLLLGIGNNTEENEWGVVSEGMKIVLFDVSNPEKPKTVSEKVFKTYDSPAQYNPKAITVNSDKGYAAIPFTRYTDDDYYEVDSVGALVISLEDGELAFNPLKKDAPYEDYSVSRCVYIDDFIYVADCEGIDLLSFELK